METIYCPVIDGQINGTLCLEITGVADREINPSILPHNIVWNEKQQQKCLECPYHSNCYHEQER